jgi:hypothetical protein
MISRADVEKLRSVRAPEPAVLSLYMPVPLDPTGLRSLAAKARDLMNGIGATGPESGINARVSDTERDAVLDASLAAVNEGAVAHLLVTDKGMIQGFVCGRCGALNTGRDECPDWGTAARAVPDLAEEMVQRTLDDDAQVTVVRDAPFNAAAKLRFPVTAGGMPGTTAC